MSLRLPAEPGPLELAARLLPDGRRLSVVPLLGGRARLCESPARDHYAYDRVF